MRRYLVLLAIGAMLFVSTPLILEDLAPSRLTRWLLGGALLLGGVALVRSLSALGQRGLLRLGHPHLLPAVRLLEFSGYLVVTAIALSGAGYRLSGLLAGGAVAGAVLGLAAQTTLSNVLAGLVLTLSASFRVGDRVAVRSWAYGGVEYTGRIVDMTLIHTVLEGPGGLIKLPNARMVDSVLVLREGRTVLELSLPPGVTPKALQGAFPGLQCEVKRVSREGLEAVLVLPEGIELEAVLAWLNASQNQAE
ncbi:MAG: hypothetical protein C4328_13265 [Meiothermus sp.]